MASNFRYWVVVAGAMPTAFRARHSEELLPTLKQLQRTQTDVVLKWFERGRFWDSPEAARQAQVIRRRVASERGRDWRPGGSHQDPRAKYDVPRDVRRARFRERLHSQRRPPAESGSSDGPGRRDGAQSGRGDRPTGPRRPGGQPQGRKPMQPVRESRDPEKNVPRSKGLKAAQLPPSRPGDKRRENRGIPDARPRRDPRTRDHGRNTAKSRRPK